MTHIDERLDEPTAIELCAGAGGQALGLELAGFGHAALVEKEAVACETLRLNRPAWNTIHADLREFCGAPWEGVDLVAAGVPCPPFSVAGKQLGAADERDLFPEALRIVREAKPSAVMLENVRGLLGPAFREYREALQAQLEDMGYRVFWGLLHASDFGVPQLRPRTLLVAISADRAHHFHWPRPLPESAPTVGEVLRDQMGSRGWPGAESWALQASGVAPTLVGGSQKHGGADLGPTRSKKAWAALGVDGMGIADAAPGPEFQGMPRLTVEMAAIIQGFPADWTFVGRKTAAYRQVGNAFPPPVACAVGRSVLAALRLDDRSALSENWQPELLEVI